jgi:hypothetical protein
MSEVFILLLYRFSDLGEVAKGLLQQGSLTVL